MTVKAKFLLAFLLVPLAAVAFTASAAFVLSVLSNVTVTPPPAVDEAEWGHVRAFDGAYMFLLAPGVDARSTRDLGLAGVVSTTFGAAVADDEHMANVVVLEGKPMGKCGMHFSGPGVTVTIAVGRCVPPWATVSGDPEHHRAKEWIRVQNMMTRGRVVVVRYQ